MKKKIEASVLGNFLTNKTTLSAYHMQTSQLGGLVVSNRNLQESNLYIFQCLGLNACLALPHITTQ